jgi:large subunit ribosomal protein L23
MTSLSKAKYADIILKPRITEKASFLAESNVYSFEVASVATKKQVADAIKAFYNFTPIKVNMVKNPTKEVFIRGKKGFKAGVKKAYVYLKKGDKIE